MVSKISVNLSDLVRDLDAGEIALTPRSQTTHNQWGSVNEDIAHRLGLKEILYGRDRFSIILPTGYFLEENGLETIREAVGSNGGVVGKYWGRRSDAIGNDYNFVSEGFGRYNKDTKKMEAEKDVPPEDKLFSYDFWVPIGICEVTSIPEGFALWGRNIRYHGIEGLNYVSGLVSAYSRIREGQPEIAVINIQGEPFVRGIPFDSGIHRGESTVPHSQMPPHKHDGKVSGINDTTIALAQLILDTAITQREYNLRLF